MGCFEVKWLTLLATFTLKQLILGREGTGAEWPFKLLILRNKQDLQKPSFSHTIFAKFQTSNHVYFYFVIATIQSHVYWHHIASFLKMASIMLAFMCRLTSHSKYSLLLADKKLTCCLMYIFVSCIHIHVSEHGLNLKLYGIMVSCFNKFSWAPHNGTHTQKLARERELSGSRSD